MADLPLYICPPTSFPAPEEDGGSDREFPRRANQKHGLHVGGQSFIPSFISAEAVATLRRLDHVCRAALLVFVCFPEISLITAPGWEIALWLINPN